MKLKKYIELHGISVSQTARELKKTRTWVSLVINERKKPGVVLVNAIRVWSDGAVQAVDLRPDLFE